jgi:hypothetical protein
MRSESKNALSAVLSTEGPVAGPCWEKLKPKGPTGFSEASQGGEANQKSTFSARNNRLLPEESFFAPPGGPASVLEISP